jgi:Flp pilus assembly protein TadG
VRVRTERAQATIEFALLMPIIAVVFLLGVDGVLIARDQLLVVHAAREGARRAALTGDLGEAAAVVHDRGAPGNASVSMTSYGGGTNELVGVTVRWNTSSRLIVIGRFVGGIAVEHTTVMRRERSPDSVVS